MTPFSWSNCPIWAAVMPGLMVTLTVAAKVVEVVSAALACSQSWVRLTTVYTPSMKAMKPTTTTTRRAQALAGRRLRLFLTG
jgi:hypothetical protein